LVVINVWTKCKWCFFKHIWIMAHVCICHSSAWVVNAKWEHPFQWTLSHLSKQKQSKRLAEYFYVCAEMPTIVESLSFLVQCTKVKF
jgi:hypothetical protein